jgi:DNA-directed RNA polymerase specialized sigma24 family protein
MAKLAVIPEEGPQKPPATLGDVLYAKAKCAVPEQHWATLVEAVAAGDQLALHELYEMAHRIVFTLIMRLTANRETAEELTIDIFHDVWRRAWRYDAANGMCATAKLFGDAVMGAQRLVAPCLVRLTMVPKDFLWATDAADFPEALCSAALT